MEKNTYRPYFEGKTCDVCKAPAVKYRYSSRTRKGYMLCSDSICDYKNLVTTNYITLLQIPEVK